MTFRARTRVASRDRGASVVEFVILAGPLFVVTFLVLQAALLYYARSTALAAATQGANAARAYNAPANAGNERANNFLNTAGGGLRGHQVTVTPAATSVTVTVSGTAVSIIPFFDFPVQQSASGPIERFVR